MVTGEGIPSYMLNGGMTKVAMQILIDYAYTSFLEVPDALVKDVYLAAWKLRMEAVVNECARHLITELTADSCIEIRSLPGISGNKTLIAALDTFINSNVSVLLPNSPPEGTNTAAFSLSVCRSWTVSRVPANAVHPNRGALPDKAGDDDCLA